MFTQPAGTHAFFAMVGMGFKDLRSREEEYAAQDPSNIMVLEASRETGKLRIWSMHQTDTVLQLQAELEEIVSEAVTQVKEEIFEVPVGREKAELRVLLGQGGLVTEILMPQETRKVFITKPSEDASEDSIREKFRAFGKIRFMRQFPNGRNWGIVIYQTAGQAAAAVDATQDDEFDVAELERGRAVKGHAEFKAILTWCRRFCRKGLGFVDMSPAYIPECLAMTSVFIGEKEVGIEPSRRNPDETLCLKGLPGDVTEDLIERLLLHALSVDKNREDVITKVSVQRENVGQTSKRELQKLKKRLEDKFQRYLTIPNSVQVFIRPLAEQTAHFRAEALFKDPIEGFEACRRWRGCMTVYGVVSLWNQLSRVSSACQLPCTKSVSLKSTR
jgi:hypothetical protein